MYKRKMTSEHPAFQYAIQGQLGEYVKYFDDKNEFQGYKDISDKENLQELLITEQENSNGDFFRYINKIREDDFTSLTDWDKKCGAELYNIYQKSKLQTDPSFGDGIR